MLDRLRTPGEGPPSRASARLGPLSERQPAVFSWLVASWHSHPFKVAGSRITLLNRLHQALEAQGEQRDQPQSQKQGR
jgi:hypothetical protein